MREDMSEVIIERPRRGSRWMRHARRARRADPKVTAARDPEQLAFAIGLRRAAKFGRTYKSLNENLAPLRRYLERQVDRPWNKVWSEISAHLKADSTVQQHVRDHVGDFVAMRTFMKDGEVWCQNRWGMPRPLKESWELLFVDPRSGLLRRNKLYRRHSRIKREADAAEARDRAKRMRELAPGRQVHLFGERGWWELTLAPIVTRRVTETTASGETRVAYRNDPYTDIVYAASWTDLPPHEFYGRWDVHAVAKRQLSRAEITRLGLPRA
jgi:hypothetical protein